MTARNAMEIFTALEKSNCRRCGEKTCLAFAGAVFTGRRSIDQCPLLTQAEKERLASGSPAGNDQDGGKRDDMEQLKGQLATLDFDQAAERCGGVVKKERLVVKVLGKDFGVDRQGRFSTDIHVNPWVVGPFLTYVIRGKGLVPQGKWISFRELTGGKERYALFRKRCEEDLSKIADGYPELFADMVQMFDGREVEKQFAADVSVVLFPLPRVPIMICYWQAEERIGSSLNIYFDATADANIGIDGAYSLCGGLANMFEKLAVRHGLASRLLSR